jgi:16S rRNA (adenine1518-N6/adenine1519-N6)-dimethyltransferase
MIFAAPRKRFGQHFLHDRGVVTRILNAFDPQPGQHIAEIGPGRGALTLPLLERVPTLHAIELDRDLVARLPELAQGRGELVLHQADALKYDFTELAGNRKLRLIGNLPYNISTPLLFHLIEHAPVIDDMLFMLQKEVADRLTAAPNSKDYSRLSVMIQWRFTAEHILDVAPGAFTPPPKVDSTVVRLIPKAASADPVSDPERFSRIVKAAFAQRRKTLRNSLRELIDDTTFEHAGIDSTRRAETLSLEEFARLARG